MKTKLWVGGVIALMLLFSVVATVSAVGFIQAPQPLAKALGVAVLMVVAVGLWTLYREIRFGVAMERMGRTLETEGGLPVDDLPRSPGGRVDRAAADAQFEHYRTEAEAAPEDWRSWYRLALAYDARGTAPGRGAPCAARQGSSRADRPTGAGRPGFPPPAPGPTPGDHAVRAPGPRPRPPGTRSSRRSSGTIAASRR